jgi:hypothetical protein
MNEREKESVRVLERVRDEETECERIKERE